jgi:branched-chain amino acid transport system substrate-binding protein
MPGHDDSLLRRLNLHNDLPGRHLIALRDYGYAAAQTMAQVLKQAGDNLTRENVMKQAASLKDFAPDTLIPGIKVNTGPNDFAPIEQLKMMRFKGGQLELFGDIISAETGG